MKLVQWLYHLAGQFTQKVVANVEALKCSGEWPNCLNFVVGKIKTLKVGERAQSRHLLCEAVASEVEFNEVLKINDFW